MIKKLFLKLLKFEAYLKMLDYFKINKILFHSDKTKLILNYTKNFISFFVIFFFF